MFRIDTHHVLALVLAFAIGLTASTFSAGAQAQSGPPFRSGEVAVYASSADLGGYSIVKELPNAGLTVVDVSPGRELAAVQSLRARGLQAGVNHIAHAFAGPDDPLYSYQWHMPAVQSNQAWTLSTGTGVTVAVLDSGLAAGGSDGIGCVTGGTDIVNGDSDPSDGDGHGTHVSGTVAQATNNATGVAGLAYDACVMPVKVLDDNGSGSFADIADGVYHAVDNGAKVINLSLGTNARWGIVSDPIMDPALDYAYSNGVTVVAAAGNDGWRKNVSYPASYGTTIAVGATDASNDVPRYSNRGDGLDLTAPGGDTSNDDNGDGYADGVLQETFGGSGWSYYFYQGTSMAAPHAAAAAALLIADGTYSTPDDVRAALTGAALDLGSSGWDKDYGYGLLQAYGALTYGAPPTCTDADGDGWCIEDGDCDDSDPAVNPGASELCDGIDNDCDGTVDEGCSTGCTDADGDGWCVEDGDCDDSDPHVYPGHPDHGGRWGRDGKDNDCNGIIDG